MNPSVGLFRLIAVLGIALAACGKPAPPSAPEADTPPAATLPQATLTATAGPAATAPATVAVVIPAATSRGPDLQASDPTTARLDAGSLQLVEFFRFT